MLDIWKLVIQMVRYNHSLDQPNAQNIMYQNMYEDYLHYISEHLLFKSWLAMLLEN